MHIIEGPWYALTGTVAWPDLQRCSVGNMKRGNITAVVGMFTRAVVTSMPAPHNRVMENRQAELDDRLRAIAQRAEFLRRQIAQLRQRRAEVLGAAQPGAKLTAPKRRAYELQIEAGAIAAAIAATEDSLADSFDQMARLRPGSADRLQAKAAQARRYAAKERREAERHRRTAAHGEAAGEPGYVEGTR